MNQKHLIFVLVLSLFLASCVGGGSSGASRVPVNINSFGTLQSGSIVVDSNTYSIATLQNNLTPTLPLAATGTGICSTIEPGTLGTTLCLSNISATSQVSSIPANTFVINNTVGVSSTKFYRISYNTPGAPYTFSGNTSTPEIVSALIIMPQDSNGNSLTKNKIRGVILYYHPTISSKQGVPGGFDSPVGSVDLSNTLYTDLMLAAIYASQGYVVVAPDYVGQGVNTQVMHPYVIAATTNALSGIYALKAARSATSVNSNIVLPDNTNLYITSYSEGGPYALWASRLISQSNYGQIVNENGFNLRRTIGISGAYDLSGATSQFMSANADNSWDPTANVWNVSPGTFPAIPEYQQIRSASYLNLAGGKALFASYLLVALAYYNGSNAVFDIISTKQFVNMQSCLNMPAYFGSLTNPPSSIPCSSLANGTQYNLPQLFNSVGLNSQQIFNQAFAAALLTGYVISSPSQTFGQLMAVMQTLATSNNGKGGGNNSIGPFINAGISQDPLVKPHLQAQDIAGGWIATSPLELIYLKYDSAVTNINSLEACGLSPNMTNGVKVLSQAGMVNCTEVNNASSTPGLGLYQQSFGAPMFLDHGWAEPALQMVALQKILSNP